MQKDSKRTGQMVLAGLASGFLNGLFGSGGGVVAVLLLRPLIGDEKKAHASATMMILVLSLVSLSLYALYGQVPWSDGFRFIPGGLVGAVLGTRFLKNVKGDLLRRIFGAVLVLSGAVMLIA